MLLGIALCLLDSFECGVGVISEELNCGVASDRILINPGHYSIVGVPEAGSATFAFDHKRDVLIVGTHQCGHIDTFILPCMLNDLLGGKVLVGVANDVSGFFHSSGTTLDVRPPGRLKGC